MKWSLTFAFTAVAMASGCDAVIGSTGQDTGFERVGTLDCAGTDVTSQDFVRGTANDPARCGPQSQPIVQ